MKAFAADMSLDTQAFNECLDSGKYTDIVETETQNAQSLGVSSTPSFLVNGQPVVGAQDFSVFKQIIDEGAKQ